MSMRRSPPVAFLIATSLLLAACSGDDVAPAPELAGGHGGSDGGKVDAAGAGSAGAAGSGGTIAEAGPDSPAEASQDSSKDAPQEAAKDGSPEASSDGPPDGPLDDAPDVSQDGDWDADGSLADGSDEVDADPDAGDVDALDEWDGGEAGPGLTLRVMAANLSSGSLQSYDPGHGIRIFQGLKPDVVMIQEFNYGTNTSTSLRAFVDTAFGTTFDYYREPGGQIPNGVISRYPILQSGDWIDPNVSNRDFTWVKIDLPGTTDLWAVSVHMLTSSALDRAQEAQALIGYLNAQVPPGDLLVLGGDFNVDARTEDCITNLASRFITTAPWPADEAANENTNHNRNKPYDWVMASPSLHAMAIPLVIGSKTFPSGLVFDSRVYSALSEVPPILKTDSDAPSMQHMAVVRAFLVQ